MMLAMLLPPSRGGTAQEKNNIFRFPIKNMKTIPRKTRKSAKPSGYAKIAAKHRQGLHSADSFFFFCENRPRVL